MTSYIYILIVRFRLYFIYDVALIVIAFLFHPFLILYAFFQLTHLENSLLTLRFLIVYRINFGDAS